MQEFDPMTDLTLNPAARSWLESANSPQTDFPIQNLPLGIVRPVGKTTCAWRIGVAIGDQVLDVPAALGRGVLGEFDESLRQALLKPELNALMALGRPALRLLRERLFAALLQGSVHESAIREHALWSDMEVEHALPARIGDYTDFYTSIHHATRVGSLFRPDNPLLPNYRWVPIGYHGRSSSIGVSGQQFARPWGQVLPSGAQTPVFQPSARIDYELELGLFIGRANALGEPVSLADAESHAFGLCLLNDWSARDLQAWEYQPLGPFLAKNFASTISPWVVSFEALEPYRCAWERSADDPQPLPYLDSEANRSRGAIDITLEVLIQTAAMRESGWAPERLSLGNFRHAYWTLAQMIAHHTVNGCNLQPGDLLGTGTQSGPEQSESGSLLELTRGGKEPVRLSHGEERRFLEDGDEIILRAWCEREGLPRIGFGEVRSRVLPAIAR